MKPVPFLFAALAALVLLVGAPLTAQAAEGASTTAAKPAATAKAAAAVDPTKGMTKAETANYLASHADEAANAANAKDAARRAKGSAFERETLDQKAFTTKTTAKKPSSGGGSIARMLFGLLVVGGLIFAIHYLLKRWGRARANAGGGTAGVIDVVATTQLAQGRAVHLIRVGNEVVLVGATEHSITRLGEVDQRTLGLAGVGTPETGSFTSLLQGAIEVAPASAPLPLAQLTSGSGGTSVKPTFVGRFVENLKLNTAR